MNHLKRLFASIACTAMMLFTAGTAGAQTWPDRPVRLIVPAPAGSPADVFARTIGPILSQRLGQSVVIDNRPGANYILGSEAVAKAPADGYTLLLTASPHTINPALYPNLPFDPIKDFQPITTVAVTPFILVVHPTVPAKTVPELIALAKSKPGALNYGSAGNGSALQLTAELFNERAGVKIVHVPYKGVTQAVTDLMGGQLTLMFAGGPVVLPQVRAGKLRALATSGAKRTAAAPELPTVAEAGLPGFDIGAWYGIMAPARTPAPVVRRLHDEIVKILQAPELKERWTSVGADVVHSDSPEQFASYLRTDMDNWAKFVKDKGIKVD